MMHQRLLPRSRRDTVQRAVSWGKVPSFAWICLGFVFCCLIFLFSEKHDCLKSVVAIVTSGLIFSFAYYVRETTLMRDRKGWFGSGLFNLMVSILTIWVGLFQANSIGDILKVTLVALVVYTLMETAKPESDFGLVQYFLGLPLQWTILFYMNNKSEHRVEIWGMYAGAGVFLVLGSFWYSYRVDRWLKRAGKDANSELENEKTRREAAEKRIKELENEFERSNEVQDLVPVQSSTKSEQGDGKLVEENNRLQKELEKEHEQRVKLQNELENEENRRLKELEKCVKVELQRLEQQVETDRLEQQRLELQVETNRLEQQRLELEKERTKLKEERASRHIKDNIEELVKKAKYGKRACGHIKKNMEELIKKAEDAKRKLVALENRAEQRARGTTTG